VFEVFVVIFCALGILFLIQEGARFFLLRRHLPEGDWVVYLSGDAASVCRKLYAIRQWVKLCDPMPCERLILISDGLLPEEEEVIGKFCRCHQLPQPMRLLNLQRLWEGSCKKDSFKVK